MFILTAGVFPTADKSERLSALMPDPLQCSQGSAELRRSLMSRGCVGGAAPPVTFNFLFKQGVFAFKVLAALTHSGTEGSVNTDV